jgi:drug/metabolite transporter (DMT)-like permease
MVRGRPVPALAAAGAAAIWGGMYVVSKYVLEFLPPLTLVALRLSIAGVLLGALTLRPGGAAGRRPPRGDVPRLLLCGVVGFGVSLGAQFTGTSLSTAHDGALITSATPAFIALFAALFLGERVSGRRWLAMALATAGVLVVALGPDGAPAGESPAGAAGPAVWLGNALLFVAAVTWALYTILAKGSMTRSSPLTVSTYATLGGLLCMAVLVPLEWATGTPPRWAAVPPLAWWGVLYLGVVSTAVAFYLWNLAFETLDAGFASLFFFVQPVVGALLGWLLLGEHLPAGFFLGGAGIATGVLLASGGPRPAPRSLEVS